MKSIEDKLSQKKSLRAFNKVWMDCDANMKISLITSIDPKYEILAYLNDYSYYFGCFLSNEGYTVDYITLEKNTIIFERFSQRKKLHDSIKSDFFLDELKSYLNKGYYILIAVDLYYWIESTLCYNKYHWSHYSFIKEYCEENDYFCVFDEKHSNYEEFYVKSDNLLMAVKNSDLTPKTYSVKMNDIIDFEDITSIKLAENAFKIIQSLQCGMNRKFWLFSETDYNAKAYMDIGALYLKKVESRQICNMHLMIYLSRFISSPNNIVYELLADQFELLSKEWSKIRMLFYKMYTTNQRDRYYTAANERIQSCIHKEIDLWREFIRNIINEKIVIHLS